MRRGGAGDDRGSGSVAAVGVIAAVVVITSLMVPLYGALVVRQSVAAAADASALAAADVAIGLVPGYPCEVAGRVANANGASLVGCAVEGFVVTVTATRTLLGLTVSVSATAGPPAS